MTGDMAFECLLVSRDSGVFTVLERLLGQFSVSINLCLRASRAFLQLAKGSTDLIVIDWEGEPSWHLLEELYRPQKYKRPTVVAIATGDQRIPGAHVVLKKPVSSTDGMRSLKIAYSQMLRDYRRQARHAVMLPIDANDDAGQGIPATLVDIGQGGIGLHVRQAVAVGRLLSFRLRLAGMPRELILEARVLWSREYGRVGCEFGRVPPIDRAILQDWLDQRIQVKKPRIEI